jgi:hypothetical protein
LIRKALIGGPGGISHDPAQGAPLLTGAAIASVGGHRGVAVASPGLNPAVHGEVHDALRDRADAGLVLGKVDIKALARSLSPPASFHARITETNRYWYHRSGKIH